MVFQINGWAIAFQFAVAGIMSFVVSQVFEGFPKGEKRKMALALGFSLVAPAALLQTLFHEASHSFVAKTFGIKTLAFGVNFTGAYVILSTEVSRRTPIEAITISLAGPLSSLVTATCFILLAHVFRSSKTIKAVMFSGLLLTSDLSSLIPLTGNDGWNALVYGFGPLLHLNSIKADSTLLNSPLFSAFLLCVVGITLGAICYKAYKKL